MDHLVKRKHVVWISMAAILLLLTSTGYAKDKEEAEVDLSKPATYVGSEACIECHAEKYDGWKTTFHPYKFKDVNPNIIVADFGKNNTYTVKSKTDYKIKEYTNKMVRKGDDYFITTLDNVGKEQTYKVKYVIGGFWKQRFVTEFPNGGLHILPLQWNVETSEWTDYHGIKTRKPGDKSYWAYPKRTYQLKCTGCHNTNSQINYNSKADTYKSTWTEKGVGCEMCHGPASHHLAVGDEDKTKTIINPAKLPDPRRGAMVCGSCHNRGKSPDGKYGYPAAYKPGDNLEFLYDEKPGLHPDGSSKKHHQQYIDWQKTGHAATGVQCWDCHLTHSKGVANKSQLKLPGNKLCLSCHEIEATGVHGIHSVNNCIGCHMPNTAKTAIHGDIRNHGFKVIPPMVTMAMSEKKKKQPNSCNLCHYHQKDDPATLQKVLDTIKKQSLSKYTKK